MVLNKSPKRDGSFGSSLVELCDWLKKSRATCFIQCGSSENKRAPISNQSRARKQPMACARFTTPVSVMLSCTTPDWLIVLVTSVSIIKSRLLGF